MKKPTLQTIKQVSFLQRSSQSKKQAVVIERVRSFLAQAGTHVKSDLLSTLAIRIQVADDHFVKVRGLVKDLIAKLKADALSENTQKQFCDKQMTKAMNNRDSSKAKIEEANAAKTMLESKKAELNEQIQGLTSENAADMKALNDARQLRAEEKQNWANTIALSTNAIAGVKSALATLEEFYSGAEFLQTQSKWTPENADRSGKTVADRAPEVFQDEYKGKQAESKGILGILEVCQEDFERVKRTTERNEKQAAAEFDKLDADTKGEVAERSSSIKGKDAEVVTANADITDEKETLRDNKKILATNLDVLESLQAGCVDREGFADRKKQRLEEIASLKEAVKMLDSWQN